MQNAERCVWLTSFIDRWAAFSANIAEGYSRSSKKDQARFYEYALGSAQETRDWYYKARNILEQEVSDHRISLCVSIIKQLLKIIPNTRKKKISEGEPNYSTFDLFTNTPMPKYLRTTQYAT